MQQKHGGKTSPTYVPVTSSELHGPCAEGQSCFGETRADFSAVADHCVLSFIFALDLLFMLTWTLYDYYERIYEFMFISL